MTSQKRDTFVAKFLEVAQAEFRRAPVIEDDVGHVFDFSVAGNGDGGQVGHLIDDGIDGD